MIHSNGKQYAKAVLKGKGVLGESSCEGCAFRHRPTECGKREAACYTLSRDSRLAKRWIWIEVTK